MTDPTTVVAHLIGEAEEDDLVKKVAQVAIDASRRYFKPGERFCRATGDSTEIIEGGMEALKRVDPAMENRVRAGHPDVFKRLDRRQARQGDFQIFDEFAYETLEAILDEYSPPFTHVGYDEGGDFGCWPDYDGLQEAVHDGTVKKAENIPASIQTMVLEPEVEYIWHITSTDYAEHWELFNAKTKQRLWHY